jgi:hypothetical protein
MPRLKDWNQILKEGNDNYKIIIDGADTATIYIGKAVVGTETSDDHWQIRKITTVGTVKTIAWANGDDEFDQVWDNRASLNYS